MSLVVKGNNFKSIREACRYYNVNYNTVMKRIERGWSVEDAFFKKPTSGYTYNLPSTSVIVDGRVFSSLRSACRYYDISINTVENRLKRGLSLEVALKLPRMSRKK